MQKPIEIRALGNQNYTAMYLITAFTSMISTLLFSSQEKRLWRFLLGLCSLITLTAAVMTVMRASFLGLVFFFLILILSSKQSLKMSIFFLLLLGLTFIIALFYEPMRTKIFITASLVSRLYLWEHAFKLFQENFLLGIGLNHFQYTFPPDIIHDAGRTYFDAHNLYWQTASQQGLWGLLSVLVILLGYLFIWWRIQGKTPLEKALKYGSFGGFAVVFIGGVFDTTLHHEHAIAFMILTGLLWGYSAKWRTKE
ncbi:MAG: O-antigen ligase family protein [Proteobacteria bacterium]|nr:O-antigen ligase family protein [Pseudomonadota bacterium]